MYAIGIIRIIWRQIIARVRLYYTFRRLGVGHDSQKHDHGRSVDHSFRRY